MCVVTLISYFMHKGSEGDSVKLVSRIVLKTPGLWEEVLYPVSHLVNLKPLFLWKEWWAQLFEEKEDGISTRNSVFGYPGSSCQSHLLVSWPQAKFQNTDASISSCVEWTLLWVSHFCCDRLTSVWCFKTTPVYCFLDLHRRPKGPIWLRVMSRACRSLLGRIVLPSFSSSSPRLLLLLLTNGFSLLQRQQGCGSLLHATTLSLTFSSVLPLLCSYVVWAGLLDLF